MSDQDKKLTIFLSENATVELKKPINEFSEILDKTEKKSFNIFKIPSWAYVTTGVVAVSLFALYFSTNSNLSNNDEQLMTFLSNSLESSSIYDESYDEDDTLLSLVD